jgi:hypothetical protein
MTRTGQFGRSGTAVRRHRVEDGVDPERPSATEGGGVGA